jgi:hypothetical protein
LRERRNSFPAFVTAEGSNILNDPTTGNSRAVACLLVRHALD